MICERRTVEAVASDGILRQRHGRQRCDGRAKRGSGCSAWVGEETCGVGEETCGVSLDGRKERSWTKLRGRVYKLGAWHDELPYGGSW